MHNAVISAIIILGSLLALFFFVFAWTSYREGEKRACSIALLFALASMAFLVLATLLPFGSQQILLLVAAGLASLP